MIIQEFTIDRVINLVTGIGTALAALAALYTVRLIYRQRKDSLRPNVILGSITSGTWAAPQGDILKINWINKIQPDLNYLTFEVLNVGLGVAENVQLDIRFDLHDAIKAITDLDHQKELIFKTDYQTSLDARTTFDSTFRYFPLDKEKRDFGIILTIEQQQHKPHAYVFPDDYLHIVSCLTYLYRKSNPEMILKTENYPRLTFNLSFEDIEGKRYNAVYRVRIFVLHDNFYFSFRKER